jgi:hypothetical protein
MTEILLGKGVKLNKQTKTIFSHMPWQYLYNKLKITQIVYDDTFHKKTQQLETVVKQMWKKEHIINGYANTV